MALFVCLLVYLTVPLFVCLFVGLLDRASVLLVYMTMPLFVCLFVGLLDHASVCLSFDLALCVRIVRERFFFAYC